MGIELEFKQHERHRVIHSNIVSIQEISECIVPDSSPDISRVVGITGLASIEDASLVGGAINLSGISRSNVLYVPEDDGPIHTFPIEIPFRWTETIADFDNDATLHCQAISVSADARILNPRKILVRAEVRVRVAAYCLEKISICTDLQEGGNKNTLQKLINNETDHIVCTVAEKKFCFNEVLRQSPSKPDIKEILAFHSAPTVVDTKYIGRKLVCKGNFQLNAICRTADRIIGTTFDLPFSQIMEMEAADPDSVPDVNVSVCRISFGYAADGAIETSVEALLQAALWTKKTVSYLKDMYSTDGPLELTWGTVNVCPDSEWGNNRESVRQFVTTDYMPREVISCSCTNGVLTSRPGEDSTVFSTDLNVEILFACEDGTINCVAQKIPLETKVQVGRECKCSCMCHPIGEINAVPVTGGFEVRTEVEFCWHTLKENTFSLPVSVEKPVAASCPIPRPSISVRRLNEGETLWDIAKICGSTVEDICKANQLASEQAPPGSALLIPTHR